MHAYVHAGLDRWQRQVYQFVALRLLPLFRQHRLAKSIRVWHRAVRKARVAAARKSLASQLFTASPCLQGPLTDFHQLCNDLRSMRLHALQPGKVSAPDPSQIFCPLTHIHNGYFTFVSAINDGTL